MQGEISKMAKRGKFLLGSLICLSIFFTLFSPTLSFGAEVSTFAGSEGDGHGQSFSYLGVDMTQGINKTLSISGRIMPNYLTYKYYSGSTLVTANSPGLFAVAGIKLFWGQTMLGFFGGAEFRNTDLSPDDSNASVRGNTTAALIQGEFDTSFPSRTNINIFGSYSGTSNFSYEKGRIKQQITNWDYKKPYTLSIGLEEFMGRNADFREEGVGLAMEVFYLPAKVSVALRSGFKHDSTFGDGIYWGLDFYIGF